MGLGESAITKKNNYEDAESIALWSRAQLNPILREYLVHVPNGGKRPIREAARLKRMGVRKGVHDYYLPVPRGIYNSLSIELKPDVKGYYPKATKDQIIWRDKLREIGGAAYIIKGWEYAIFVMELYLKLERHQGIDEYSIEEAG